MSRAWDSFLVLLSLDELKALQDTDLVVTSISGDQMKINEMEIDNLDLKFDMTAWGLPPETWDQVGKIVVKYVT